jgi:hypothetical protein
VSAKPRQAAGWRQRLALDPLAPSVAQDGSRQDHRCSAVLTYLRAYNDTGTYWREIVRRR